MASHSVYTVAARRRLGPLELVLASDVYLSESDVTDDDVASSTARTHVAVF